MATSSRVNFLFFFPADPCYPSCISGCASIAAKPLRERTAGGERSEQEKGGEGEEVERRREEEKKEEEAFRAIKMQRCSRRWHRSEHKKKAHVLSQLQTRDATKKKEKQAPR